MKRLLTHLTILFFVSMLFPLFPGHALAQRQVLFGGATVGTPPYVFALGFSTVANKYYPQYKFMVQGTGGSVENIKLVNQKEIEIGLITPGVLTAAKKGERWFKDLKDAKKERYDNVRGMFTYFHGAFHLIVKDGSPIKTIHDAKGKRVAIGAPGSNVGLVTVAILEAHGLKKNVDYTGVELDGNTASQAWQDGMVDLWSFSSDVPGALVSNATALNKFRLISLDDEKALKIMRDNKTLSDEEGTNLATIQPGSYPTLMNKNPAVQLGILMGVNAHKDVSDEIVYSMTKAVFDHLEELQKTIGPTGKSVNTNIALQGFVVPLHPGAVKYFKEKGMMK